MFTFSYLFSSLLSGAVAYVVIVYIGAGAGVVAGVYIGAGVDYWMVGVDAVGIVVVSAVVDRVLVAGGAVVVSVDGAGAGAGDTVTS